MTDAGSAPGGAGRTVIERGRVKAFRPMPAPDRAAAFRAGVAAYERGDYFLAHELLEPAWMGTDDPSERALHSGLIKLAAAGVHAVRHNPAGVAKNLAGARSRLAAAAAAAESAGAESAGAESTGAGAGVADATTPRLDLAALLRSIDDRLAEPAAVGDMVANGNRRTVTEPPQLPRRPHR